MTIVSGKDLPFWKTLFGGLTMPDGIPDEVVFYHFILRGEYCFSTYRINVRKLRFMTPPVLKWGTGYRLKSVRRTRSHRMKFCVQKGPGALPSTSDLWQMDRHKHCLPQYDCPQEQCCTGNAVQRFKPQLQ